MQIFEYTTACTFPSVNSLNASKQSDFNVFGTCCAVQETPVLREGAGCFPPCRTLLVEEACLAPPGGRSSFIMDWLLLVPAGVLVLLKKTMRIQMKSFPNF